MPQWGDDEGRYHYRGVEVPHAPVRRRRDCGCAFCVSTPEASRDATAEEVKAAFGEAPPVVFYCIECDAHGGCEHWTVNWRDS